MGKNQSSILDLNKTHNSLSRSNLSCQRAFETVSMCEFTKMYLPEMHIFRVFLVRPESKF